MSTMLTIRHRTVYQYRRPVTFNPHRLMFRPRDSHDMRLIETRLEISPTAQIRWFHDVFGNSAAIAVFEDAAAELRFESTIVVEHFGIRETEFSIDSYARTLPFTYSSEEIPDLGRTVERHYADPERKIDEWARQFMNSGGPTETDRLLIDMTKAIKQQFNYETRATEGVQTPVETLDNGAGSCRDYALLMMEAARCLGLAARFVSGYLYDPALGDVRSSVVGAGHTHAWVQVYLPGAGWVEFDPTNGQVGGKNLIRVAVARDPSQAVPLQGTFNGGADDYIAMTVTVEVTATPG